tara:strand:- start:1634 stop:2851 length:1218 start_codon:yes stop_codon:yes gene_type:complete
MSLFEKLKNKRQDLTEQPGDFTSKQRKDNINMLNKMFGSKERSKKTASDVKKTVNTSNKKETQRQKKIIKKNVAAGDKLLQDINKRKSADLTRADAINRAMGTSGSTEGAAGAGGTTTKTKTVSQAEVSKKAQDFTKEINKKNKNRTFFDPEKAKEARKKLIAKRKEYGIDRKGNISDAGVKRYAQKTKQLSSGSNVPAKVTAKDLKVAKVRAVGGEKVTNKSGKVIGTTTGKYGGKLGRARNKNMKSYAQLKKEIDLKDLQVQQNRKSAGMMRSKEIKAFQKQQAVAKVKPAIQKAAKTFAPATKADRQFYKAGTKLTKLLPKKAAPVAKKGLKLLTKAGPAGRIAGAVGLALLAPGVRKTAVKVAGATAVGLGLSKAAGGGGGKTPIKPTITKKRINLSSGKD